MLKRYPHTGKIIVVDSTQQDEGGNFIDKDQQFEIKGRYEPSINAQNNRLDYKAKFYTKKTETLTLFKYFVENGFVESGFVEVLESKINVYQFQLDNMTFMFGNREFELLQFHNYQKHCEIWLN